MTVFHLDGDQWLTKIMECAPSVKARTYVLREHIAGTIYYYYDDACNMYYLDCFYPSTYKKEEFDKIPFFEVHKQVYRMVQLDEYQRRQDTISSCFC